MDKEYWSPGICCYCGYEKPVRDWKPLEVLDFYCADCIAYNSQQLNMRFMSHIYGNTPVPPEFVLPEPPRNPELN